MAGVKKALERTPEEQKLLGSKTIVSALALIRAAIDIGIGQEMGTLSKSNAPIDASFVKVFGPFSIDNASEPTEEAYERALSIFGAAPEEFRLETIENILQSVYQTVSTFDTSVETGKEFVNEQQGT